MSRHIGTHFENEACKLVKDKGFCIVATNYTVPKVGEIDIIAFGFDTLIIIEVKAKSKSTFGTAVHQVTPKKQQKIINTALYFLQDERYQQYANCYVRFDVIGFDGNEAEWLEGAFLAY